MAKAPVKKATPKTKAVAKVTKTKEVATKIVPPPAASTKMTSRFPMHANIQDQKLSDFTRDALFRYGSYVVEERAVPDFRDGLKPSHRAVLWSLHGLGLTPDKAFKKTARTVGDGIGKYHPHGDKALHDAMATITNTVPPFVDGQGGWGNPSTPPAAMRYSEARMSKFAHAFLLDPKYLKVVPYLPNYSNDDVLPLYLPALLPTLLFVTSIPAPAYGVRAGNPAFSLRTVADVISAMLRGKTFTAADLCEILEIMHPFGCMDDSTDADIQEILETGRGPVTYKPLTEYDEKKREIRLRSYCPTTLASTESIDRTMAKIAEIDGVRSATPSPSKKDKRSGPYGALFIVECVKNITDERFDEICHKVDQIVRVKVHYRLGITVRKEHTSNDFKYLNYAQYFSAWVKYRIKLELRMIEYLLEQTRKDLHVNQVYLFAIENMDKLLKALPKVLASNDPDVALSKVLKLPAEDAKIILDRKIRQLAKMEADALKKKIKELETEIKKLLRDQKNPGRRAADDTDARVAAYLKKPDTTQQRIEI